MQLQPIFKVRFARFRSYSFAIYLLHCRHWRLRIRWRLCDTHFVKVGTSNWPRAVAHECPRLQAPPKKLNARVGFMNSACPQVLHSSDLQSQSRYRDSTASAYLSDSGVAQVFTEQSALGSVRNLFANV